MSKKIKKLKARIKLLEGVISQNRITLHDLSDPSKRLELTFNSGTYETSVITTIENKELIVNSNNH